MQTLNFSFLGLLAVILIATSCSKKGEKQEMVTPVVSKTDSLRAATRNTFTFYSFKDGRVIETKDSASTKWDFAIRLATIIVNSGSSGPGNVGVITQKGIFDTFKSAPESGYAYDTTGSKLAINSGLTTGWYNYDPASHNFTPKAGIFFVFKTNDNHYVKVEMLSARYEDFTGPMPLFIWHKFRYVYQPNGTKEF